MRRESEVVIVGGGVHGTSAAYHLAKAGKQVALLERHAIASAASGASGGIIRCHYSNEPMVRLAHRAAERWPDLEIELGQPVDYVRNGLIVAVAAEDAETMQEIVRMHKRVGVETEVISLEEIRRWIPEFNTDGLALATYEAEAGYADPYSAAVAFGRKAKELGAEIYTDTRVIAIEAEGTSSWRVVTEKGTIRTPLVINCAGAWAGEIARMVGVEIPVTPGLLQMAAFDPKYPGWHRHSPTWLDMTTMTYCRPDAAGMMLAGGGLSENAAMENPEVDPDDYPTRPPMLFEAEISENLTRRCPWAQGMTRVRSWAGPDGNSPDFHLIFGPVPGVHGYLQIVGGSGNSFKLCPATGEAIAEYVTTGRCTYVDLDAFSITRFQEGRPFRGKYRMHIIG
jgi:sarcosine oxidase subunit beta